MVMILLELRQCGRERIVSGMIVALYVIPVI